MALRWLAGVMIAGGAFAASAAASDAPHAAVARIVGAAHAKKDAPARETAAPPVGACPELEAVLILRHADPRYSQAVLRARDGATLLRSTGHTVRGDRVEVIHWDRVILLHGDTRCELRLGEAPPTTPSAPPAPAPQGGVMPGWLADNIQHLGDGRIAIERGIVDRLVEEAATLGRGLRAAPAPDGIPLARVAGPLAALGFQKGDVLHEINGHALNDPRALLELYARISTTDSLQLQFSRGGKRGTLDVVIR
jgi:hypothetical protein